MSYIDSVVFWWNCLYHEVKNKGVDTVGTVITSSQQQHYPSGINAILTRRMSHTVLGEYRQNVYCEYFDEKGTRHVWKGRALPLHFAGGIVENDTLTIRYAPNKPHIALCMEYEDYRGGNNIATIFVVVSLLLALVAYTIMKMKVGETYPVVQRMLPL